MLSVTNSCETGRKFISEDPNEPNEPKYAGRLTKDERTLLEPLLRRLHLEGASRELMLEESRSAIHKQLTFPQLDGLRTAFRLQTYRRRQTDRSDGRVTADHFSYPVNAFMLENHGVATAAPSTFHNSRTIDDCLPGSEDLDRPMSTSETDLNLESDFTDSDLSMVDSGSPASAGRSTAASSIIRQDLDVVSIPIVSDTAHVSSCGPVPAFPIGNVTSVIGFDAVDLQAHPTWWSAIPQSSSDLVLEELGRFVISIPHPRLRYESIKYSSMVMVFGTYSLAVDVSRSDSEIFARLNYTAGVLYLLKAFAGAFDFYFFIYCFFRRDTGEEFPDPPQPQMVLAAINCGRSAATENQVHVAASILRDVTGRLEYFGMKALQRASQTGKYLETLKDRFSSMNTENATIPPEDPIDAAYWTANRLLLAQTCPSANFELVPDYLALFCEEHSLQHFHECQFTRQALLDGLEEVLVYTRASSRELNTRFGRSWQPLEKKGGVFAQALSCLLLKDRAKKYGRLEIRQNQQELCSHEGFPCDLKGQAIAVLPFVLIDCLQFYDPSTFPRLNKHRPADGIRASIEHIQKNLQSKTDRYHEFVNLCFKHLSASTTLGGPASFVSDTRMRSIATALAGLAPIADCLKAAHTEDARNGVVLPPTISEDEELTLEAKRASTSSLPTLARSLRSSNSSDYRLFSKIRHSIAFSLNSEQTRSSGERTSWSSHRFSKITGFASNPSSVRESISTVSFDITMSG